MSHDHHRAMTVEKVFDSGKTRFNAKIIADFTIIFDGNIVIGAEEDRLVIQWYVTNCQLRKFQMPPLFMLILF
jgi:hypothetical protein